MVEKMLYGVSAKFSQWVSTIAELLSLPMTVSSSPAHIPTLGSGLQRNAAVEFLSDNSAPFTSPIFIALVKGGFSGFS